MGREIFKIKSGRPSIKSEDTLPSYIKPYHGYLYPFKCSADVRAALQSYSQQRLRCGNPNHVKFKNYGLKGIRVKYGTRDFVAWWLYNIENFHGKCPTVGRIDHTGNYEFSNIVMQDKADNSKERVLRLGTPTPRKKVLCFDAFSMEPLMFFESSIEASRFSGVGGGNIRAIASNKFCNKTGGGFVFRYIENL